MAKNRKPRVLVVGANFAGLAASRALDSRAEVTVVDGGKWFEWLPNVHELVSGVKTPAMLRAERSRLVEGHGHQFRRVMLRSLDPERGVATTTRGGRLRFEACILALGGAPDHYGVRGAETHAYGFKSVDQCARIGHALDALLACERVPKVTIVGGGLEGVEALGEILRLASGRPRIEVTVVETAPRLMARTPPALHRRIAAHCARAGVSLRLGRKVVSVSKRGLSLDDGSRITSDLTIWTGGVRPPELLFRWGLAEDSRSWASVNGALQSTVHENVFVAGDAAGMSPPLAKQAYHALDMGRLAARNAVRLLGGRPLLRFRPAPKPMLVAFGALDTFLVSGSTVVASPALAIVKEAVFQLTMADLDRPTDARALAALARRVRGCLRRAIAVGAAPRDLARLLDTRILRS